MKQTYDHCRTDGYIMGLQDHYSEDKFKSLVPRISDLYDRECLTDVEVTSIFLDYLGFNPALVAEAFSGLSPGVQNALIGLVKDGDVEWYKRFFSPLACPGQVVEDVTIITATKPPIVSMQILRGRDELFELPVEPEHPARVAIETLRHYLESTGRLQQ